MTKTKFVNPSSVVAQLDISKGSVIADFGCGSGFYTLPLAKVAGDSGTVYAIDILPDKLAVTQSSAGQVGLKNVTVVRADLEKPLHSIDAGSVDVVVMSNIVHQVAIDPLLANAYSLLKTGGMMLVVDWKKEITPFGPDVQSRVSQEKVIDFAAKAGLRHERDLEADGYHYAVLFVK
jgi:ubiquinone/menaquinone biosynthesis C-methylase UbiE